MMLPRSVQLRDILENHRKRPHCFKQDIQASTLLSLTLELKTFSGIQNILNNKNKEETAQRKHPKTDFNHTCRRVYMPKGQASLFSVDRPLFSKHYLSHEPLLWILPIKKKKKPKLFWMTK